jgi:hypothetical protein
MLKPPMNDNRQEQRGNVRREMEILREYQKEMLQIKNTSRIKDAFDGHFSRFNTAEERI